MNSIRQNKILVHLLLLFLLSSTACKSEFDCVIKANESSDYLKWTNNLPILKEQDRKGKSQNKPSQT